jgi:hypothetical protein
MLSGKLKYLPMTPSQFAKMLGQRGGKKRSQRLSANEKKSIASLGGQARAQSYQLARRVEENFRYLEAINELRETTKVRSLKTTRHKLPGMYE